MLGAGSLRRAKEMVWEGKREGDSGWGTRVYFNEDFFKNGSLNSLSSENYISTNSSQDL